MIRILAAALFVLAAPIAHAQEPGLVVKESKVSVKETLDAMTKALEEKGIKVALRVDHAAAAKAAGLDMPATEVIMFGNPRLGTPLMQSNPHIAIDLPMKAVAWQDKAGKTWIGYTPPDALKARYGIKDKDEVFKTMTGALEAFTSAAVK
jgi:uncharacterized protein (DUF302 family)